MPVTLELCTFDPGVAARSPAGFAAEVTDVVDASWADGADVVLLPEFTWIGLQAIVEPPTPRRVAEVFWSELLPTLKSLLNRPGKAVVLGSVPFWDEESAQLRDRVPILIEGEVSYQDKLHLPPGESEFAAGTELRLWEFGGVRFAVVVGLDIEIPEVSARLRGCGVDVLLVPSASESILGVERVDRCASARAVELGCIVGVSHLSGAVDSGLIGKCVGRAAVYFPSQSVFEDHPRWFEGEVISQGVQKQRVVIDCNALEAMRARPAETNPALLETLVAFDVVSVGDTGDAALKS